VKIYTKTGDDGKTGLLASGRLSKDAPRIEAYGTVDELNAALGVARASGIGEPEDALLAAIQDELFHLGAALADPDPAGRFHHSITAAHCERLERVIDDLDAKVEPLTAFILPGGTPAAAQLHLARTICRRAERRVVTLAQTGGESVPEAAIIYLNRLGDLLFVLARLVNRLAGVLDVPWRAS
jgi:cob(I)alamin adenosyltransferase